MDLTNFIKAFRLPPYKHQIVGVEKLLENPYFFIADEMGAGKTKQTIDAAQILALMNIIKRVIVVAPAPVRSVWFDPELGELAKHLWVDFPCTITEYHALTRTWDWFLKGRAPQLRWFITNYDFIRKDRINRLLEICDGYTLLVLDESSAIKSWKALQTKAAEKLRAKCGRVILLNGTPIANSPGDLYSQAHVMHPAILGCKTFFHFRARYAIMGGWQGKQIVGWHDLDDLQQRMAPYVIRRLKEDCLDLPPKIDSVPISVPLSPETWKIYKEMKDEMVAWLNNSEVATASQAIVKGIRLAQITSGFVGGVEIQEREAEVPPDWMDLPFEEQPDNPSLPIVKEVGREKLDAFISWLEDRLIEDPKFKLLLWCRFRPETERAYNEIGIKFPKVDRGLIWGGQKKPDRDYALRLLDPRTTPDGPVVVVGTPATGSMGLNLTAAHTVMYMSNDFSLKTRLQSEDRVHRPGQDYPVSYFDMIATGPQGQKTIDHRVVKALKDKEDIADFTTAAWLEALTEE